MAEWANTSGAPAPTATPTPAPAHTSRGGVVGGGRGRNSWTLAGLSVIDIGLSLLMASLGVLTILSFKTFAARDISEGFLAGYMIIFALLLFAYEIMWWSAIPSINKSLRKNFGFLYGLRGKGLYLIFVAFLCLGLGSDPAVTAVTYATGIAFLTVGVLHLLVAFCQPEVSERYAAPTAGIEDIVVV
eukprot:CAMPEP_0116557906 /NCGR_PEP_ID=MMETSP0397-20121206/9511_1 /TAXON_ID=216820 /ORGANISM="Cyclophora tenuis, Strain ECT3854" /LENGTH=186 /DNA_ID=CAMNT_0004083437 /DNA_START=33 /DNA_END=593 /DNA_ORIENTATION=-